MIASSYRRQKTGVPVSQWLLMERGLGDATFGGVYNSRPKIPALRILSLDAWESLWGSGLLLLSKVPLQ